ncbi:MAG: biosynthetic-type acetolactate synthase large subunit [Gemmatimonadetes bacterium]|nr:biosynthetic-type acetolactate synthase large subunit [Gemmatimonadota bacterium]
MRSQTAADALCQALVAQGVDVMFGHPGGAILPFYDALHRAGAPRHVLMRHEQGAAHAADGYARATGRVGVCVATSGPGATNLVTGLAAAIMDGVPIIAITGQVPSTVLGTDAFQETDVIGVTMPVTKHGYLVENAADLPSIVAQAFQLAAAGRPGPVLIDIPKNVQNAPCPAVVAPARDSRRRADTGPVPYRNDGDRPRDPEISHVAELVNRAERPVVMIGRGVVSSGTSAQLRQLIERADLPVIPTLLGLDGFPATHPNCLGMPGMHGTVRANRAIQHADLILGLGLRFDDRVIGRPDRFAPNAAVVHVDIDAASMGRTIRPHVRLIGDLRDVLPALAAGIAPRDRSTWWSELRAWPREPESVEPWSVPQGPLTGRAACRGLAARIAESGAVVATDVGQHQMWLAQELRDASPRTHLTSGGLGAMGYALPAGVGAAVGCPERSVWVVAGDGGFQMTMQELATAVQERLRLRIAVVNNGFLGMVRQWQELFYSRRYSAVEIPGPDFTQIARAYEIPARAVSWCDELEAALEWAEAEPGPVLLDLHVEREDNVYPMVPSGAALDEMVTAPREVAV